MRLKGILGIMGLMGPCLADFGNAISNNVSMCTYFLDSDLVVGVGNMGYDCGNQ